MFVGEISAGERIGKEIEIGFAEEFFGFFGAHETGNAGIGQNEAALLVFDIDGVRERVDERAQEVAFLGEGFFGFFSFHELPDLAANGTHHAEDIFVRFLDVTAEEFNNAEDFVIEPQGYGKGGMKAFFLREGRVSAKSARAS